MINNIGEFLIQILAVLLFKLIISMGAKLTKPAHMKIKDKKQGELATVNTMMQSQLDIKKSMEENNEKSLKFPYK